MGAPETARQLAPLSALPCMTPRVLCSFAGDHILRQAVLHQELVHVVQQRALVLAVVIEPGVQESKRLPRPGQASSQSGNGMFRWTGQHVGMNHFLYYIGNDYIATIINY